MNKNHHVVIAYDDQDTDYRQELAYKFRQVGANVWTSIGRSDLAAIGDAVQNAYAVVVVISPAAATSARVKMILQAAVSNEIPILPIWFNGDNWEECTPSELVTDQYIDARGKQYYSGIYKIRNQIQELKESDQHLPSHFIVRKSEISPGWDNSLRESRHAVVFTAALKDKDIITSQNNQSGEVGSSTGQHRIYLDLEQIETIGEMIDLLYAYLGGQYARETYGHTWVILKSSSIWADPYPERNQQIHFSRIVLPWLSTNIPKNRFSSQIRDWLSTPIRSWFERNWGKWPDLVLWQHDLRSDDVILDILTNHKEVVDKSLAGPAKGEHRTLRILDDRTATLEIRLLHFTEPPMHTIENYHISAGTIRDVENFQYRFSILITKDEADKLLCSENPILVVNRSSDSDSN